MQTAQRCPPPPAARRLSEAPEAFECVRAVQVMQVCYQHMHPPIKHFGLASNAQSRSCVHVNVAADLDGGGGSGAGLIFFCYPAYPTPLKCRIERVSSPELAN